MTFKQGRLITLFSGAVGLIFACIGLAMPDGSMALKICALIAVFATVCALIFYFKNIRCPYCGTMLFYGMVYLKTCPHCKRELRVSPEVEQAEKEIAQAEKAKKEAESERNN